MRALTLLKHLFLPGVGGRVDDLIWDGSAFAASIDREKKAAAAKAKRKQELEDLGAVVRTPEGFRLLLRLLRRGCWAGPVSCTEAAITRHNDALRLLEDIYHATPLKARELIDELICGDGK